MLDQDEQLAHAALKTTREPEIMPLLFLILYYRKSIAWYKLTEA